MHHICMKCSRAAGMRQKIMCEIVDVEHVTMKNGRHAVRGKCGTCGAGMYKIIKKTEG